MQFDWCLLVENKTFLCWGYKSLSHEIVEDYAFLSCLKAWLFIQLVDGTNVFV
jgi:hypothetical protein